MRSARKIIDPRRHTWCDTPVDDIGLLVDADEYYPEFYRVAARARRYLLLAGWQFDSDVALLRGGGRSRCRARSRCSSS